MNNTEKQLRVQGPAVERFHCGQPLADFEWIDKPIPSGVQHKAPDCRSSRWWEHQFGGRYCADCWPCTDPIMLARESNE